LPYRSRVPLFCLCFPPISTRWTPPSGYFCFLRVSRPDFSINKRLFLPLFLPFLFFFHGGLPLSPVFPTFGVFPSSRCSAAVFLFKLAVFQRGPLVRLLFLFVDFLQFSFPPATPPLEVSLFFLSKGSRGGGICVFLSFFSFFLVLPGAFSQLLTRRPPLSPEPFVFLLPSPFFPCYSHPVLKQLFLRFLFFSVHQTVFSPRIPLPPKHTPLVHTTSLSS